MIMIVANIASRKGTRVYVRKVTTTGHWGKAVTAVRAAIRLVGGKGYAYSTRTGQMKMITARKVRALV